MDPKKKIGYILSLKGGIPSFNYREIEAVVQKGFEVHIFPTKVSEGLYMPKESWTLHRPSMAKAGASMLYWLFRRPGAFSRSLGEALRDRAMPELGLASQFSREMVRDGISLIHCHFADRKMFTAYFCSVLSKTPFTVTVHSHELTFYADRKLFKKALARAAKLITVCDYNRNVLVEGMNVPPEKVETIRLEVPLEQFKMDDRMKVLTVAKFHDYKGYDVLVDAARKMKDEPVVFWIVGDGPVDVKGMASDLIKSGKVKVLGPVNEDVLKILYQSCDVFCLASKTAQSGQKEGLPVSIMEAMAYSKPVVSTAHAGIPELVETIVVPENDPEAIALGLRTYMIDLDLRKRDGARNRVRVEKMHGPENLKRLVEVFDKVS
jgi:glycosyltransferase involved in cell wall biosynthesis